MAGAIPAARLTPEQARLLAVIRAQQAGKTGKLAVPGANGPLSYNDWLAQRGGGNPYVPGNETQVPKGPDYTKLVKEIMQSKGVQSLIGAGGAEAAAPIAQGATSISSLGAPGLAEMGIANAGEVSGLSSLGSGAAGAQAAAPVAAAAPNGMSAAMLGGAAPALAAGAIVLGDKWVPQTIGKYGKKIAQGIFGKGAEYNYNPKEQVKNDNRIGTQVKNWGAMSDAEKIKLMDDAKSIGALSWQGRDEKSASPSVNFSRFFGNSLFRSNAPGSQQQAYSDPRSAAIHNGTYVPTREELQNNTNMTAGARERYLKLYDQMQGQSAPTPGTPNVVPNGIKQIMENNKVAYKPKADTMDFTKLLASGTIKPLTQPLMDGLGNVSSNTKIPRSKTSSPGIDKNGKRISY